MYRNMHPRKTVYSGSFVDTESHLNRSLTRFETCLMPPGRGETHICLTITWFTSNKNNVCWVGVTVLSLVSITVIKLESKPTWGRRVFIWLPCPNQNPSLRETKAETQSGQEPESRGTGGGGWHHSLLRCPMACLDYFPIHLSIACPRVALQAVRWTLPQQ
jgi:hypothetical protein